ncbi:hypothetical protein VTJ04DRAFT_3470 [Mycothermus thermophilus]|uniref:uncharacterized protein n=1 Tax=Humicola insolens TaxID=85995 RepID=UPI00374316E8
MASTIQSQKASVVSTLIVPSTKGTDNTSTTQPTEPSSSKSAEAEPVHVPIQPATEPHGPSASQQQVLVDSAAAKPSACDQARDATKPVEAPCLPESTAYVDKSSAETETSVVAPDPIPIPETPQAEQPPVNEPSQVTPASTVPAVPASPEASEAPRPDTSHPAETAAQTAKPKRARKRTTPTTNTEDSGEQGAGTASPKRSRKKAAPAAPGEDGQQRAAPKPSRTRKRVSAEANGNAEQDGETNGEQPKKKRRPPRNQRQPTPPDAEHVEIDVTKVKMADLARDMHIGKKFSLHDELMQREREKRMRYNEKRKRLQAGEDPDGAAAGEASANASSDPNSAARSTPQSSEGVSAKTPATEADQVEGENEEGRTSRAPIGETYQIVNGQIVLDHRSLQVDRHARAREEADQLVEVEENDFTHHTTTATYLRRNLKPQQWTDEETELFYKALAAFGTDFDTISRMFKGKTRKHIKLKFNREERVNPQRVNAALVGEKKVAMDIQLYQQHTGQEYESTEAIYAEQRRAEEEFEARQKALEDEQAEELRRRKEEVLASLSSAAEGGNKGRGKGRKKKAPVVVGI